jgi:hypothetical protein
MLKDAGEKKKNDHASLQTFFKPLNLLSSMSCFLKLKKEKFK